MLAPPPIPDHQLLRRIGRGSYGEVWLARNLMGAARAVKLVYRRRFESDRPYEREFAGIQRYEPISRSGEGLVQILHAGHNAEAGCFYYVMELADDARGAPVSTAPGSAEPLSETDQYEPRTLRLELARRGRLPIAECVEIGLALAGGAGHLHRHGLVHRDIKPSNIIFVGGRAKLADLGLVGFAGGARTFVGTEGYIPPEGPGEPGGDLFALGKVLYEAASGLDREAFPELPDDWLSEEAPPGAIEFFEVLLRACEPDCARRYPSAAALRADLALLQSGQSVRRVRQLERRLRRLRIGALATGAALALVGALTLLANYRARIERTNFERSERLRLRAEAAERDAREQLFTSLLGTAASLDDGRPGARGRALQAVREAARVHPASIELRSAAASVLALPDFAELGRIEGPPRPVSLMAVDPTSDRYARLEADGRVHLRRWGRQGEDRLLDAAPRAPDWVWGFSPDGRWLGGRGEDGRLLFWDTDTGKLSRLQIRFGTVQDFDFLCGRGELAVATAEGRLDRMDLATGVTNGSADLHIPRAIINASPDGSRLAVYHSEQLTIVDPVTGASLGPSWLLPGAGSSVQVAWAPDGGRLAFLSVGFEAALLGVAPFRPEPVWLRGHVAEVVGAAFSPDGRWLATTSWDLTTRVWEARTGRPLLSFEDYGDVFWSGGGALAVRHATGTNAQTTRLLSVSPSPVCRVLGETPPAREPSAKKGPWMGLPLADGRVLAVPSYDGVHFWDTATGDEVGLAPTELAKSVALIANPPGLLVASPGRGDLWPLSWDPAAGALRLGRPRAMDTSPGFYTLASAFGGRRVYATIGNDLVAWEGGRRWTVCTEPGPFPQPAASPDGRWVVVAIRDYVPLRLRNATNGVVLRELPDSQMSRVAFSPDSRTIAINSASEVRLEELETGRVLWRSPHPGFTQGETAVAFSPDGALVAASARRAEVGLHEAAGGGLIERLKHPQPEPVSALVFTTDSRRLAVVCPTHVVQLWDLPALRDGQAAQGIEPGLPHWIAPGPTRPGPVRVLLEAD